MNLMILFNGIIIMACGLGITLSQLLGSKLVSGLWFICFGALFMAGYVIYEKLSAGKRGSLH